MVSLSHHVLFGLFARLRLVKYFNLKTTTTTKRLQNLASGNRVYVSALLIEKKSSFVLKKE